MQIGWRGELSSSLAVRAHQCHKHTKVPVLKELSLTCQHDSYYCLEKVSTFVYKMTNHSQHPNIHWNSLQSNKSGTQTGRYYQVEIFLNTSSLVTLPSLYMFSNGEMILVT